MAARPSLEARPLEGRDAFIDVPPLSADFGAPDTGVSPAGPAARPDPATRNIPFGDGRSAMVVMPYSADRPARLLAMIHGLCTGPSYACGAWKRAAAEVGLLVCPVGNATCGPAGSGGPSWDESFASMDEDLEASIKVAADPAHLAALAAGRPFPVTRDGAVLAGFSRGGYAAVILALRHPGRWPFLIINEADVELTLPIVRAAGVRAVALIAGEWGTQVDGERKTQETLSKVGFPIRLWVMPKTGHSYSAGIETIMTEALDFVLAADGGTAVPQPTRPP